MIFYLFSRYSSLSIELIGDVKKIPDVYPLCIDTPKVRKAVLGSTKIKISYVPAILEITDGNATLYEGIKAKEWIFDILSQLQQMSQQASHPASHQMRPPPPHMRGPPPPQHNPSSGVTDIRNLPPEEDDQERYLARRPPGGPPPNDPRVQPYVPTTLMPKQQERQADPSQLSQPAQPLVLTRAPIAATINPTEFDTLTLAQKRAAMLGESTGGEPRPQSSRGDALKEAAARMAAEREDLDLSPAELGRRMAEQQSQGVISQGLVPGGSGPPPGGYGPGLGNHNPGSVGRAFPASRKGGGRVPSLEEIQ